MGVIKGMNGNVKPITLGVFFGLVSFAALVWAEGQRLGALESNVAHNTAKVLELEHSMTVRLERLARIETKLDYLIAEVERVRKVNKTQ